MDLFIDKELTFEKLGMESRMGEDMNTWPRQILDELNRQAPFTSDYTPKVVLTKQDNDKRYALGQIELTNKLAINPRDDATPRGMKGSEKIAIPVIIKDGVMKPLDMMLADGRAEPLTEDRARRALFRPNLFEAIRKRPGDMSLIEQLYPPHRQTGSGGGRGMVADAGTDGTKQASAGRPSSLMDAILPTIRKCDLDKVAHRLATDVTLRAALVGNAATLPFINKLASIEGVPDYGRVGMRKVASSIRPDVIQIKKIPGGFRVKTASSEALIPDSEDIPRAAAIGEFGGDVVQKVEQDGTVTLNTQPAVKETLVNIEVPVAHQFGIYKVREKDSGAQKMGWVFPNVMGLDGVVLPMSVFSNGSDAAMQENIAGIMVDNSTDLIDEPPSGFGCFYYATASGAQALVPVNIEGEVESEEGTGYECETILGDSVTLKLVPGLKELDQLSDNTYAIPGDCGFIPMREVTELASSPEEFFKQASAQALPTAVRVTTQDGRYFSFEGQPIEKIAKVTPTRGLDLDDAVFLGAVLGQYPEKLASDLGSIRSKGRYEMWFTAEPVSLFREKHASARKEAVAFLERLPDIKYDLLKEAAPLEDPTAVDKVLSIGFVNPENLSIFAGYLSDFETTVNKLSEILIASRMGLQSVDEGALQRSLVHLDKVIVGLKSLSKLPQV